MKPETAIKNILVFCLVLSCRYAGEPEFSYNYTIPEEIDDGWETASLSSVRLNPRPIAQMMDHLNKEDEHKIHSILIIKDNKLVFEEYFQGYLYSNNPPGSDGDYIQYDRDVIHFLASVTKSVTSVLVGIAVSQGHISSIEDKVSDYLPQYSNILVGEKANITLRHLLTMTSGLDWDESTYPYGDYRNDITRLFYSADPIKYILEKPLLSSPGSSFVYKGGDTNVLGGVIKHSSEFSLGRFAEHYLFEPLEIEEYIWEQFGSGDFFASGGLYLRPRDLAKIGHLFLTEGWWQGKHILSENWIMESQEVQVEATSTPWAHGYGFQWWIRDFITGGKTFRCFFAAGWGDQHLFIFPGQNMIVQFNSGNYSSSVSGYYSYPLVESYILAAINDPA